MSATNRFKIRRVRIEQHGFKYWTFVVSGWLAGRRVRRQFTSEQEAIGAKNSLEVEAANGDGAVVARNTRLSAVQIVEAESAYARLAGKSLSLAVEWFMETYRPPITEMTLESAQADFEADRKAHVRPITLRDYKLTLTDFRGAVKATNVHEVKTTDVLTFLTDRKIGKKRWNNLRGDLHAFFEWSKAAPRQWTQENPVAGVPKFKVTRGVPEILTAKRCAELMRHVEEFENGNLVPYFALALFAGLRPSIVEGEIWKLSQLKDLSRAIDVDLRVIRLSPDVSKTKQVRQIKIRPNLLQWLLSYPIADYPLWIAGMKPLVTEVRKKFGLSADILRHTWTSMHVAKFKSIGDAALEAGNSEAMVRKHYLNLVSESDATAFWEIAPS